MYVLIAELWVHEGQERAFEALERELAEQMARHGGRIQQAIRIDREHGGDDPFEIHVVVFPDRDAFDAYRGDTNQLAARRDQVIARTSVRTGRVVDY